MVGIGAFQVRIGSVLTNERLHGELSLCSRQIAVTSALTRRCKFRKFELYIDILFLWYVYLLSLIKFYTTKNSRDFKCTNIIVFSNFMIISC